MKLLIDIPDEDYQRQMEFLNEVLGLPEFFDKPVRTLSLGQRMRADLGAALLHNPKVLYLDEPTIGLDLVVKDNIRKAIKEINAKYQTTVILTTHDIGDIEELCSRIIIIDEGKKIYDGTLEHLKDTYGSKRKVVMEVKDVAAVEKLDLVKILDMSTNPMDASQNMDNVCATNSVVTSALTTEIDADKKLFTVTFDKHRLQAPQILSAVMEVVEVTDIKLQETELADIVKEIYNHGVNGGN